MKRLFVGGLGHTVSEKDLKDRFGKFGDVSDVEITTRKDEHGAPLKTFGYININITDAEYKRCINVLNKSTWKGGTLLIQLAKESFLHRLAEERQQIAEKAKTPTINHQEKLVESLKEAGIEKFHMKAAVPGTEIPGHKDWVVSKFGRVLPVLNLKCEKKNKIFKYDPSKYCHNIKRLETADDLMSVTKLTWEVSGGDDEISKKRRGEFPKQKPCLKRSKVDASSFLSSFTQNNGLKTASAIENKNATVIKESRLSAEVQRRPVVKKSICVFDSDVDSEDEVRMLVAQEQSRKPKQASIDEDDDNLEVVGDDFDVKPCVVWCNAEQDGVKTLVTSAKDDEEYDSADTDEILTQRKTLSGMGKPHEVEPAPAGQESPKESIKNKGNSNANPVSSSSESNSGSDEAFKDDSIDSNYEAMMGNCYQLELSLADLEQLAKNAKATSDDENEVAPKEEPKTPSVPPKKRGNNPEDILAALLGDNTPDKERKKKKNKVTTASLPAFIGTKDLFGGPTPGPSEPILKRAGQTLDGDSTVGPKRLKQDLKLSKQSISGDKSQQKSSKCPHQKELSTSASVQLPQSANKVEDKMSSSDSSSEDNSSSEESKCIEEADDNADVFTLKMASATQTLRTDSVHETNPTLSKPLPKFDHPVRSTVEESSSDDDERTKKKTVGANNSNTQVNQEPKTTKSSGSSSSGSSSEESETSDEDVVENTRTQLKVSKSADSKKVESHPTVLHPMVSDVQKQLQDNQKRLAALEQRQKETEQQKKLIQGALSNVDTVNTNRGKHIVFDSDEENDETSNKLEEPTATQKKSLFEEDSSDEDQQTASSKEVSQEKKNKKSGGSKLFDSSDDEDDGDEEDRFQIKPQFEGKAGQKLMEMQARFGTDSRFHMDSRFLQSDDEKEDEDGTAPVKDAEEELVEEKNKNMDILQSILNTSIQPKYARKESAKSKIFKDVSALHYDPTREEHTAFEIKTEQPKKESKAARRKKREEVAKLPEVSKEIYFEVSMDLKEVFGATQEKQDEKETVSWDKETENKTTEDDTPMDLSSTPNVENHEDSSGVFKFAFFGEDAVTETTTKTDEYKIELLKEAKFSWQVDPRFQDSSSDEEGVDEVEEDQSASSKTTEEPTPSKKKFFFFFQDDERLKQGPGMFYRSAKLEQREAWEKKRMSLREECRKKHRDAKRRQRSSQKT
ncbi:nucleolar protein 8 [Myxocyprinus asiaticus]|uniref:nucleolar protein 8 n=1 Tax=Myxocyprinus asiaticus TaxID=70543 RepID=UPI00222394A5|nr:nucleolar protein 8 [Myxocyprinus asiaticus]XP_051550167.1 nucleolar protein 8 [Myxocyprinus asiaticus]XP_051550168.1 nucleolar protein 8 [Myxocyprinus asiaticus]